MSLYEEDDLLQISGLQHFSFCPRQWALIHIEQQWADNLRTVDGTILHERSHSEGDSEKRGNLLIVRGLRVFSRTLGVSGQCDVVEFSADPNGVMLSGHRGRWLPTPVEYKRGKPKESMADKLQLCCQGMCLEEMLGCIVSGGYLFYHEIHRREEIDFSNELRGQVSVMLAQMRAYYDRGYTPKVKTGAYCKSCSLKDLCLPKLCRQTSASRYIASRLAEDAPLYGKGES